MRDANHDLRTGHPLACASQYHCQAFLGSRSIIGSFNLVGEAIEICSLPVRFEVLQHDGANAKKRPKGVHRRTNTQHGRLTKEH